MALKVIAVCPLHYGADYIGYAIRSIYEFVDEIFLTVSVHPWETDNIYVPKPDSIEELLDAAFAFNDPERKIHGIVKSYWCSRGEQINEVMSYAIQSQADLILQFDADEIWPSDSLKWYLDYAHYQNYREYGVPQLHFWRSFGWTCADDHYETKIISLKQDVKGAHTCPELQNRLYHFGYAKDFRRMHYKSITHMGRRDWRPRWFQDTYVKWDKKHDGVHPCSSDLWQPRPFDRTLLPEYMRNHPYYSLDLIS